MPKLSISIFQNKIDSKKKKRCLVNILGCNFPQNMQYMLSQTLASTRFEGERVVRRNVSYMVSMGSGHFRGEQGIKKDAQNRRRLGTQILRKF